MMKKIRVDKDNYLGDEIGFSLDLSVFDKTFYLRIYSDEFPRCGIKKYKLNTSRLTLIGFFKYISFYF
jgi:hypothetical protein